jgi:DNA-binding response OmpR family regulator
VKVLLVEDERAFADALARGLGAEGCRVDVVGDGAAALDAAADTRFDAIVLDLMLPRLNGFRVVTELRARGDWTPVLVLTAKQGELDQTEVLDSGADDFLSKPFSFPVLVARLRALVRRHRNDAPVLRAGDLVLDTRGHRCRRGDVDIDLTAREFALLEALLQRVGDVVPKHVLLDEVWDFAFEGDANIVEVYVGYLRRKVDRPFGRAAIETVRSAGYRIRTDGG